MAKVSQPNEAHRLGLYDLELAYELAYLRIFLAWEVFLEETLLRLMCGYSHSHGQEPLLAGASFYRQIRDAEAAVLNGRPYKLWHNPDHVIRRAAKYFDNGHYEQVLASAQHRLMHFAAVRHRIAHQQRDAAQKFDAATMSLNGRRYRASRPGRFLRDVNNQLGQPNRWIASISAELQRLAVQICI